MFSTIRNFTTAILRSSSLRRTLAVQNRVSFKTYKNAKDILSTKEINIYKKLFDQMDSNRDGFLTKDDFRKGLKEFVNYTASEEELKETMETLDTDKDGSVGFDEFINYIAWSRQMRTDEAITYAFHMFDKNNDGLIDKGELHKALVSLGLNPDENLLSNIMLMSDQDNDGRITLKEFRQLFYSEDIRN